MVKCRSKIMANKLGQLLSKVGQLSLKVGHKAYKCQITINNMWSPWMQIPEWGLVSISE